MRYLISIFILALLPIRGFAADEIDTVATVGSIDGGDSIQVRNGEAVRTLHSGEGVHSGDQILTGPAKLVTLHVPDGSVLVLGRSSDTRLASSENAASTIHLESGTMRALISKINRSEKKKKFRFMVRTKSAIIGVRGTDFVIEADSEASTSKLHTLEGTVEVAKNEMVLVEKGGTLVVGGQAIVATPEKIEEPQVFDPELFSQRIKGNSGITIPTTSPTPTPSPSPAASPIPAVESQSRSSLFSFQAGFRLVSLRNDLINSQHYGANLGWTPTLALLGNWLAIRGDIAASYLFPSSVFPHAWWIFEAGPILSLCLFEHLLVEGGAGLQGWIWSNSGAPPGPSGSPAPAFSSAATLSYEASLGWYFPNGIAGVTFLRKLNRVFVEFKMSGPTLAGIKHQATSLTFGIAGRF